MGGGISMSRRSRTFSWKLFVWLMAIPVALPGLFISASGLSTLLRLEGIAYSAFVAGFLCISYVLIAWSIAARYVPSAE